MKELATIRVSPVKEFDVISWLDTSERGKFPPHSCPEYDYNYYYLSETQDIVKGDSLTDDQIKALAGKAYMVELEPLTEYISDSCANIGNDEIFGDIVTYKNTIEHFIGMFKQKSPEEWPIGTIEFLLISSMPREVLGVLVFNYNHNGCYNEDFEEWFEFAGVMDMSNINMIDISKNVK